MAGLAEAVQGAVGQPASVRIGMVESVDAVTGLAQVSMGGTILDDVGVIGALPLLAGNPVVLLGQSSDAGSDPASWVAIGSPSPYGLRSKEVVVNAVIGLPVILTNLSGAVFNFKTTLPQTLVQMWSYADYEVTSASIGTGVVRPTVDGALLAAESQIICENPNALGRWSLAGRARFILGPGDHEVRLQGYMAVGVAGILTVNPGTTGFLINIYG